MKTPIIAVAITLLAAAGAHAQDVFIKVDDAKALLGKPDVRFVCADSAKDFAKEHVPGATEAYAHDLALLDDVKACKGLPMCEARAATFIGQKLGIDDKTQVIVYDGGAGANASGTWFFLALYGHKNVKIIDGGLATWKAHGGAVESGAPKAVAAKTFKPTVQWDMIASVEEVKKATADAAHYLVVDARHNLEEYTGKQLLSGLTSEGKEITVARGGAIPTAVFSPWTKYAGNKGSEADKPTLKDTADLKKQLEKLKKNGYAEDKTVVSYCHVGLGRGSFQYLALKQAGHKNVKLYVGSWHEWGNDASLPLATQQ
jgi:thiosulfate/3-mercaptopyruvate sulfurtransferase